MWRATVLALGLALCLLGGEFMVVDRLVLAETADARTSADEYLDAAYRSSGYASNYGNYAGLSSRQRVFVPPEWAPWGLMSAGVLTVLYGTALPKS